MSPEHRVVDEMWVLNVDNVAWTSKNLDLTGINWQKVASPNPLGGLKGHAAVGLSDKNNLIIFGGVSSSNQFTNSVVIFETQTRQWLTQDI
jgi:N-acetylneuraminic acid mutarotase